jgi:hypothetical protein
MKTKNTHKWGRCSALTALFLSLSLLSFASDTTRPWTFWYWMYGAVSKPGIKADLQAMKDVGLGGCYLMPIRGTDEAPANLPALPFGGRLAGALTPAFWEMVDYAMQQADSLGLEMGIHVCDGFALAGGPWITPEESMQKIVSMSTNITGGTGKHYTLMQPAGYEGYYEDIACFAIPSDQCSLCVNPASLTPKVTYSPNVTRDENGTFRATEPCWIQYEYPEVVTFRSVEIIPSGNNIQSQRLKMLASGDGEIFLLVKQFAPPRQGWQEGKYSFTYAIPKTEGRIFRFEWTPEGTEPGAEDLDAAKWKPTLKVKEIRMSDQLRINQWESKSGLAWRIADETTEEEAPADDCAKLKDIIRVELKNGRMVEPLPEGNWLVVRIGHTSTGYTNATAGGGKGLECDKFSEAAVRKQVAHWFGKFKERPHADVVKYLHVDSWECGSQNWSNNFAEEFMKRRGYDLIPWLPVMVGIPVESAAKSEQVLRDVRTTIDELKNDFFFKTVSDCAHAYGCQLSCESVAPTMMGDGMSHYRHADLPMGEFWLNSPTHDKPNDMLDAVSGAHVYGKNIIQAEGFTEVRGVWDETPASIKPLLDRNLALGMNRLFFHVFTHNPYTDKTPGMTLDGIGLFFQRDQTWFPESKALVDYVTRCQKLLQEGRPVVDIAVFTGEEMPRRALTPDKLVPMLPGLFGPERVASEQQRIANAGCPMEESPVGVRHNANILDLKDWVNPLHGYHYDSMNKDALVGNASKRCLPPYDDATLGSVAHYQALVIPEGCVLSPEVQARIDLLRQQGLLIIDKPYAAVPDASPSGLSPDALLPPGIAFAHRATDTKDIYFLSNQTAEHQIFNPVFRACSNEELQDRNAMSYNPMTDTYEPFYGYLSLEPHESVFVIFGDNSRQFPMPVCTCLSHRRPKNKMSWQQQGGWDVSFRESGLTLHTDTLFDWSHHKDNAISFFSGHARYTTTLRCKNKPGGIVQSSIFNLQSSIRLSLGDVRDVAHVWVNGQDCGIAWMPPYEVDITHALKNGKNKIEIEVVNTWHNALRGLDQGTPPYPGIWTNAKYRTKGRSSESHPSSLGNGRVATELDEVKGDALLPAGLLGPVELKTTSF